MEWVCEIKAYSLKDNFTRHFSTKRLLFMIIWNMIPVIWRINRMFIFQSLGKIPYNRGRKWEIELALRVVAHPPGRVTFSSWRLRSIDIVRTPRLVGHSVEVFVIHVPLDSVSM